MMAEHKFTVTFADNQRLTGVPAAAIILGFLALIFLAGVAVGALLP
jgi:hypothetical protein